MNDRNIIIVLGQSGMGKSLWTKEYTHDEKRLAVWDPKRSYAVEYPASVAEWWEQNQNAASFRVGGFYPEQAEEVGSLAYVEQRCCLVLEECGLLFSSRAELPDWARECVYLGRERGVSVVAVAQRPRSINIALRSQASRIVSFRQRELKDLDWLDECFPAEDVLSLARLECLDYDVGSETVSRYFVKIPGKARQSEKPSQQSPSDPEESGEEGDPSDATDQ